MEIFQTNTSGSALDITGQPVEFYATHDVSSTVNEVEINSNNEPAQNQVVDFDWDRFRLWTVDDVFKPRPKKQYLVEGLVNEKELAIFFGKYGQKKSFAAISLAINVAAGKPWIGLNTIQSPVIYINEDSDTGSFLDRIQAAFKGQEISKDVPFYAVSVSSFSFFSTPGDIRALEYLINYCKAKLVVIDTWAAVMAGANENSVEDNQPVINKFKLLIEKTGVSVIFIHHMNKDGEIRGSTAIGAGCDSLIKITSQDSSDKITFTSEKLRHSAPIKKTAKLFFQNDRDRNLLSYSMATSDETSSRNGLNENKRDIIEYAKANGGEIVMSEFFEANSTSDKGVYNNAKNSLIKKGYLEKDVEKSEHNKAVYALTK